MKRAVLLIALLAASAAQAEDKTPAPPSSPTPPATQLAPGEGPANYGLCLDTARAYPQQGLTLSERWQELGGGEPAEHCAAVALFGLRRYTEAGKRLETLALQSKKSAEIRMGMFSQAGQAWYLAGNTDRAFEAQSAALTLAPAASPAVVALRMDRAMTLAEAGQYQEAVTDLTVVLTIEPNNAEALALRANAYRDLDRMGDALSDIERAVAIDGKNVNALLERGIINRLMKRIDAARDDWQKIIALAPESDAATSARDHIKQLESDGEKPKKKR